MELRHLRYFVAVAKHLNFSRAAESLNMAQPPLGRQIRDLEDEIGTPLFIREGKRISLSSAGVAFYEEARSILDRSAGAVRWARAFGDGSSGTLAISYMPSGFFYEKMGRVVWTHQQRYPNVKLRLTQLHSHAQMEALLNKETDLAVVNSGGGHPPGLSFINISADELLFVFPPNHRLLQKPTIRFDDIAEEPIIVTRREFTPVFYNLVMQPWVDRQLTPKIAQEIDSFALSVLLVEAGLGLTFASPHLLNRLRANVVSRKVEGFEVKSGADLVWRTNDHSPLLQTFLAEVRELGLDRPVPGG